MINRKKPGEALGDHVGQQDPRHAQAVRHRHRCQGHAVTCLAPDARGLEDLLGPAVRINYSILALHLPSSCSTWHGTVPWRGLTTAYGDTSSRADGGSTGCDPQGSGVFRNYPVLCGM